MREGYVEGYISAITPGAELGGVVHDQWVKIRFRDKELFVFDQDLLCPNSYVGQRKRIKIEVIPIKVDEADNGEPGFVDNRNFIGRVLDRFKIISGSLYLIDVDGIPIHLDSSEDFEEGKLLKIEGRLDLIAMESLEQPGWRKALN
jgi:hypothetical protein